MKSLFLPRGGSPAVNPKISKKRPISKKHPKLSKKLFAREGSPTEKPKIPKKLQKFQIHFFPVGVPPQVSYFHSKKGS